MIALLITLMYGLVYTLALVVALFLYIYMNTMIIGTVHIMAGHKYSENLTLDVVLGTLVIAGLAIMWYSS